jgi:hypothetical protein
METTFTDKTGRVACPASIEHGDLINSGQAHYATRRQIEKYGLCRKCRARMKGHGKTVLAGKIETPAFIEPHHAVSVTDDHAGYEDGAITPAVDFDYDEIDRALGLVDVAPPDAQQKAGEVIREIFQFCFSTRKKNSANALKTAALRFAIIASGLRPDLLCNASQGEIAAQLHLTKAAASKVAVLFRDRYKLKFARSRPNTAREHMREARLKQGGVNRRKQTGGGGATPVAKDSFFDTLFER